MLVDIKSLDPEKYYHCVSNSEAENTWLTKGAITKIFLGSKTDKRIYVSQSVKQSSDSSSLSSGVRWEVREATQKEKEWVIQCMYERQLVDREIFKEFFVEDTELIYQIF